MTEKERVLQGIWEHYSEGWRSSDNPEIRAIALGWSGTFDTFSEKDVGILLKELVFLNERLNSAYEELAGESI